MIALDIVTPHPTWDITDPSKLHEYMACPRKYFWHYVLGWRRNTPVNHLTFGTAWHLAMEHLALHGHTQQALEDASLLFLSRYRQDFDPSTDKMLQPKDPENALVALQAYAEHFNQDQRNYETLHTEIGGVAMVSPTAEMHFKIDWMGRNRKTGKVIFRDHKTSQRKITDWGHQWTLSTQMLFYYHVLHCLYPRAEIEQGEVRCTFFYVEPKKERDLREKHGGPRENNAEFEAYPITKTPQQMQAWLVRTNTWLHNLNLDMSVLEEADTEDVAMLAFPQNENNCFSYGKKCPYFDFCASFSNPLHLVERGTPPGFTQEFWDPREPEGLREKVDLRGEP